MKQRLSRGWERVCIILISVVYVGIPLLATKDLSFRRYSDYDVRISWYTFFQENLRQGRIPQVNSYFGFGIPVWGDFVHFFFNPLVPPLLYIFPVETALRLLFLLTVIISGLAMYEVTKRMHVPAIFCLWAALLYLSNGALAARFYSGHLDFWFSFIVFPPILWISTLSAIKPKYGLLLIFLLTMLFYADNVYMVLYLLLLFVLARVGHCVFQRGKTIIRESIAIASVLGCLVIAISPRLIVYIRDIAPVFYRPIANPMEGSIHLPFTLLPFLLPYAERLYEYKGLTNLLGFKYDWYEYFAFITPVPLLLALASIKKRTPQIIIMLFLVLVGGLFIAQAYPYSPFYVLKFIPAYENFRTPMRMAMPMIALLILLGAYGGSLIWEKGKKYVRGSLVMLMMASVCMTMIRSAFIIYKTFEPFRINREAFVQAVKQREKEPSSFLVYTCCMQAFFMERHMHIINYYHGWFHKDLLPYYIARKGTIDLSVFATKRPRYIIDESQPFSFGDYGYTIVLRSGKLRLWENPNPTVFPSTFLAGQK